MQSQKNKLNIIEWLESVITALICVALVFTFFIRSARVYGPSMNKTLATGDILILQSSFLHLERGDVVVIDGQIEYGKPLVKRIIAMEGDTVDIDNETGTVYVNGTALDEPYISSLTQTREGGTQFPLTVGPGKVFVMGDNRAVSKDSRSADVGLIDSRDVVGVVLFRTYPFNKVGKIE